MFVSGVDDLGTVGELQRAWPPNGISVSCARFNLGSGGSIISSSMVKFPTYVAVMTTLG
jgi:hypothetical protein